MMSYGYTRPWPSATVVVAAVAIQENEFDTPGLPQSSCPPPSPPLFSQYQHAETPWIPEPGGPERPAAGRPALWELRVHHGMNIVIIPSCHQGSC